MANFLGPLMFYHKDWTLESVSDMAAATYLMKHKSLNSLVVSLNDKLSDSVLLALGEFAESVACNSVDILKLHIQDSVKRYTPIDDVIMKLETARYIIVVISLAICSNFKPSVLYEI